MEWISVKDEKIPENKFVTVGFFMKIIGIGRKFYTTTIKISGNKIIDGMYNDLSDMHEIDDFKFWMPLPGPPK